MTTGLLCSYHYFRNDVLGEMFDDRWRPPLFADSGAFSADNSGATVTVGEYARWLDVNRTYIDVACTLDVIGDSKATEHNTQLLEDHGHKVIPVYHVGEPWDWLHHWCERYPYVGLGGMVKYSQRQKSLMRQVLYALRIARDYGVQLHGLGLTSDILGSVGMYSVDSTSWKQLARYGGLRLWSDTRGWVDLNDKGKRLAEAPLLRSYGVVPSDLAHPNYAYKGNRVDGSHREEMAEAFRLGAQAWIRFGRWWANRFGPLRVEGMPNGPIVFLGFLKREVPFLRRAMELEAA